MTVEVRGVRRVFTRRRAEPVTALDGVDLDVGDGELVVVVGPSGSGKTTLLRAVAGLEDLQAGRVAIDGHDVTGLPPGRRGVAMVFQEYALLPHLSVHENIAFGERARGTAKADADRKAERAAAVLEISSLLHRRPAELSGGQRQRVALARAMVRRPAVFLLDEPLSGLDTEMRLRARAETRALQRRLGVAMVHVTHDQYEAMALGDRIVVLREGRVEQAGSPADVFARPASTFVARFMSALPMNLLPPGALRGDDGVVVGVRPECVRVASPPTGRLPGCVAAVEHAGEAAVVHVDAAGTRFLAKVGWEQRPREGSSVCLDWEVCDEHRFSAADGLRVT